MATRFDTFQTLARFSAEAVAETLWPTRCAICDRPGKVLCDNCARRLPHIDWWKACVRCGSPFGRVQCDLCNPTGLGRIGREELPFAACASAVVFTPEMGQLVRVFKDQGERRLAADLARFMARMVAPGWGFDAVTYVPATKAAVRYRGFDHACLLAQEVAALLDVRCVNVLARPRTRDQRALGGRERIANLRGSFCPRAPAPSGCRLLLVDDVFTTGATLCAASDALHDAGADEVRALTFARV